MSLVGCPRFARNIGESTMMPNEVLVTICNGRVAVANNTNDAERQVTEIISGVSGELVLEAQRNGEIRRSVSVRVCHVLLNQ